MTKTEKELIQKFIDAGEDARKIAKKIYGGEKTRSVFDRKLLFDINYRKESEKFLDHIQ